LIVQKDNLPEDIIVTSKSMDDDEIMSLEIKGKNIMEFSFILNQL
jgi:anthranilate synthase component 2